MRTWFSILGLVLLTTAQPAATQNVFIGPRFSLGHTFDYGGDYRDYLDTNDARRQFAVKLSLGAFTEIRLSPLLALQPELMFTRGGQWDNSWLQDYRITRQYLEGVLLAKLIVPAGRTRLQVFAGPDLRYGVGTWEEDIDDVTVAEYDRAARKAADIRNTYFGVVAGAGIRSQRRYNAFQMDARCYLSLQNSDATDAFKQKPAALWLNFGYGFSLEKRDRSRMPVRFKRVSPRDTRVESSENIKDNPFFSAYIDSGYVELLLQAHALLMDRRIGVPPETGFSPFDVEVFIAEPVEIRSGHKHPADGVWLHRFRLTRQGTTLTYNLWFVAQQRQEPRTVHGIMGTTRADLEVQYDLAPKVRSAASARVKNPANRGAPAIIVDTRVLEDAGRAEEGAWREEWLLRVGSEAITVEIDFDTGPFGIVNYALTEY